VSGTFWAVFSGGAEVCALMGAGAQAKLFYRGKPDRPALPVEHLPYVRVVLQNVDGR